MTILAVQAGATRCDAECPFCRTKKHDLGDPEACFRAVEDRIDDFDDLYITSTAETGYAPIFERLIALGRSRGKRISVLCADPVSVVKGLHRVEVHTGKATREGALRAIAKARKLKAGSVVASQVDLGFGVNVKKVVDEYQVDGVIVRQLQPEGASKHRRGTSAIWREPDEDFDVAAAFRELQDAGLGSPATCIDHYGKVVGALGG